MSRCLDEGCDIGRSFLCTGGARRPVCPGCRDENSLAASEDDVDTLSSLVKKREILSPRRLLGSYRRKQREEDAPWSET